MMDCTEIRDAVDTAWDEMWGHPGLLALLYLMMTAVTITIYVARTRPAPIAAGVMVAGIPVLLYLFVRIAAGDDQERALRGGGRVAAKLLAYIGGMAVVMAVIGLFSSLAPAIGSLMDATGPMPSLPVIVLRASLLDPGFWVGTAAWLLLGMGPYVLAIDGGLQDAVQASARLFLGRPVQIGVVLMVSVLLAYLPIMIASLPFIIDIAPIVTVAGTRLPLATFFVLAGAAIGGYLSIRMPAAYYETIRDGPDG